jgi:hypothetical protein
LENITLAVVDQLWSVTAIKKDAVPEMKINNKYHGNFPLSF